MIKEATQATKESQIARAWHIIDANEKMLGRVSTQIALLLMGKAKPYFVRNLDCGDHVVVINGKAVKVTGKKEEQKKYYHHSGYPGGMHVKTLKEVRAKRPEDIILNAVKGMLPQNKLRDDMLKRLHVFAENEHTYADKFKNQDSKVKNTDTV